MFWKVLLSGSKDLAIRAMTCLAEQNRSNQIPEEVLGQDGLGHPEALQGGFADVGQVVADALDVFHAAVEVLQERGSGGGRGSAG